MFLCQACLAKRCNCIRSIFCSLRSRPRRCSDCSEFFWPCLPPRSSTLLSTNFICGHANPITPRLIARQPRWSKGRADFMFQLTQAEAGGLRLQIGTSKSRRGGRALSAVCVHRSDSILMINRTKFLVVIALSILSLSANAETIALVKGTLINPGPSQIIQNATIIIDGDRIAATGDAKAVNAPKDARVVDCKGKFILPGYIDTHVHFFQSGDLFTRPDGADLNSVRPYQDEVVWVKSHLNDVFARYLRSGITSVVDVGGPFWNFEVRKTANAIAKAPHVAVAGPLISSVSREKLDLGDPPIVKIDTPEQAREFIRK